MVVAPSFAYLHHPSRAWQSLFALTMPVRDKSMQNVADRDIPATGPTVNPRIPALTLRLFRNSQRVIGACGGTAGNAEPHLA
jgi:hypothetical protein